MSFINSLFQKSVADNETNLRFWEDYLKNLKALDLSVYADKLKVPILVPIGSRILFRGELKHTNEITVALGADYFVKCSIEQAEVLRQHRIKDAESKLETYRKEKEYLENQLLFSQHNIFEKEGQEIVEVFTEEEDKVWRQQHRENLRKSKQDKGKEEKPKVEITDEELWNRLEELELEEELENELLENYNEIRDKRKDNSFLVNEESVLLNTYKEEKLNTNIGKNDNELPHINNKTGEDDEVNGQKDITTIEVNNTKCKLDLLQQVLDKQNQLENKLFELKNKDRAPLKTENDLISKLDEMEQLDELEDEMDRLDDIIETEDVGSETDDTINSVDKTTPTKLRKSISFADEVEDNSGTIEITFKHSEVEPIHNSYDPEKGILKPSDIYEAHSNLFNSKPTSILKVSKINTDYSEGELLKKKVRINSTVDNSEIDVYPVKETIVVKDVLENPTDKQIKVDMGARPTSLFKKRRMQNKS